MKKVGLVGWRGMVGSVLMGRMTEERDFEDFKAYFFSTSQQGQAAPVVANLGNSTLLNANDPKALAEMDIILTCQGGDYTKEIHPQLRQLGWNGYWIDAASSLRMDPKSVIILDPVNNAVIDRSVDQGIKNYIGGNCTVSLMLLALGGLFQNNLVEWATSMTYQAASGAGAQNMLELLKQMRFLSEHLPADLNVAGNILDVDRKVNEIFADPHFPTQHFGAPLAGSLIPWIDTKLDNGQSREEWKGQAEANKILQTDKIIPIDGTCVRIGAMRCHSQALTLKLKKNIELKQIEEIITSSNDWVRLIPNDKEVTVKDLSPVAVSGKLHIPVGRLRKMSLGDEYLNAFTCGDQLLWGAAEPLRRMLQKLV